MHNTFKNTVAIVTGGASGMGRSLCLLLGKYGSSVVVADINFHGAEATAEAIKNNGGSAVAWHVDVSSESAVKNLIDETVRMWGKLDYMINNAGVCITGEAQDIPLERWKWLMGINFYGVLHGTYCAYTRMISQGFGHIVNISSLAGFAPFPLHAPYSASKYAIAGLTGSLEPEAVKHGIRVSLVYPGIVKTDFYNSMEIQRVRREDYVRYLPSWALDPDRAAIAIIKGVAAGRKQIVFPFHGKFFYYFYRFFPFLFSPIQKLLVKKFRSLQS